GGAAGGAGFAFLELRPALLQIAGGGGRFLHLRPGDGSEGADRFLFTGDRGVFEIQAVNGPDGIERSGVGSVDALLDGIVPFVADDRFPVLHLATPPGDDRLALLAPQSWNVVGVLGDT